MPGSWKSELSKYLVRAEDGRCSNGIRSNQIINENPKNASINPSSRIKGQYLRTKKLSTYFNERYQNETNQHRDTASDGLNAWSRACLILAAQGNERESHDKIHRRTINDLPVGLNASSNVSGVKRVLDVSSESLQSERQGKRISGVAFEIAANAEPSNSTQIKLSPGHFPTLAAISTASSEAKPTAANQISVPGVNKPEMDSTELQKKKPKFFRPFDVDDDDDDEPTEMIAEVHNVKPVELKTPKQFQCNDCEYVTLISANLARHTRTHTGEMPFHCQVCDKRFSRSDHYSTHMKGHGRMPHKCQKCNRSFMFEHTKDIHETKCCQLRYGCGICKYSTTNLTHFVTHLRHHTGVKPFQCKHCRKRFAQIAHLKVHMNHRHSRLGLGSNELDPMDMI